MTTARLKCPPPPPLPGLPPSQPSALATTAAPAPTSPPTPSARGTFPLSHDAYEAPPRYPSPAAGGALRGAARKPPRSPLATSSSSCGPPRPSAGLLWSASGSGGSGSPIFRDSTYINSHSSHSGSASWALPPASLADLPMAAAAAMEEDDAAWHWGGGGGGPTVALSVECLLHDPQMFDDLPMDLSRFETDLDGLVLDFAGLSPTALHSHPLFAVLLRLMQRVEQAESSDAPAACRDFNLAAEVESHLAADPQRLTSVFHSADGTTRFHPDAALDNFVLTALVVYEAMLADLGALASDAHRQWQQVRRELAARCQHVVRRATQDDSGAQSAGGATFGSSRLASCPFPNSTWQSSSGESFSSASSSSCGGSSRSWSPPVPTAVTPALASAAAASALGCTGGSLTKLRQHAHPRVLQLAQSGGTGGVGGELEDPEGFAAFAALSPASCGGAHALPPEAKEVLRRWLFAHLGNPYPDNDEKDELALRTGLSVRQINTWFINARRRTLPAYFAARSQRKEARS